VTSNTNIDPFDRVVLCHYLLLFMYRTLSSLLYWCNC